MWNRACPLCFAKAPRTLILTRADGFACPSCHAQLELSRASKLLSAAAGLLAAYWAARLSRPAEANTIVGWILPLLGAVVAYAIASVLALFFFSDLVVRPKAPSAAFPQSHN